MLESSLLVKEYRTNYTIGIGQMSTRNLDTHTKRVEMRFQGIGSSQVKGSRDAYTFGFQGECSTSSDKEGKQGGTKTEEEAGSGGGELEREEGEGFIKFRFIT